MKGLILAAAAFTMLSLIPTAKASECNYDKNEIDLFTKERLVTTEWAGFASYYNLGPEAIFASVSAIKEGTQNYLALRVQITVTLGYDLDDDDLRAFLLFPEAANLLVLMADGSTVNLHAQKEITATTRSTAVHSKRYAGAPYKIRYAVKSNAIVRYALDADTSAALRDQESTHVRMSTTDKDYEFSVHGHIRRAISCL